MSIYKKVGLLLFCVTLAAATHQAASRTTSHQAIRHRRKAKHQPTSPDPALSSPYDCNDDDDIETGNGAPTNKRKQVLRIFEHIRGLIIRQEQKALMASITQQSRLDIAFYLAAELKSNALAKQLVYRGADINRPCAKYLSIPPLLQAILFNNFEMVRFLLDRPSIDLSLLDHRGYNLLHAVNRFTPVELTRELIEAGLDINHKDALGKPLLQHALEKKNYLLAALLIIYGAETSLSNAQGQTVWDLFPRPSLENLHLRTFIKYSAMVGFPKGSQRTYLSAPLAKALQKLPYVDLMTTEDGINRSKSREEIFYTCCQNKFHQAILLFLKHEQPWLERNIADLSFPSPSLLVRIRARYELPLLPNTVWGELVEGPGVHTGGCIARRDIVALLATYKDCTTQRALLRCFKTQAGEQDIEVPIELADLIGSYLTNEKSILRLLRNKSPNRLTKIMVGLSDIILIAYGSLFTASMFPRDGVAPFSLFFSLPALIPAIIWLASAAFFYYKCYPVMATWR